MSNTRRKYTQDFKDKVIKEAIETGNAALVARQYDLSANMLCRWVRESKQPKQQTTKNNAVVSGNNADLKALEAENNTLKKLLGEKDLKIAILEDLLKKTTQR